MKLMPLDRAAAEGIAFSHLTLLVRFCHALRTLITCATIKFLQNLPRGTIIRAVLLLSSEEYDTDHRLSQQALLDLPGALLEELH